MHKGRHLQQISGNKILKDEKPVDIGHPFRRARKAPAEGEVKGSIWFGTQELQIQLPLTAGVQVALPTGKQGENLHKELLHPRDSFSFGWGPSQTTFLSHL